MSIRSTGATAAQAEKYLQGIEGAMNRVQVAWEGIASTVINSDAIVGLLDYVANFLKNLTPIIDFFANNIAGQIITYGLIATALVNIISHKIVENDLAKQQLQLQEQQQIKALKNRQEELRFEEAKKLAKEKGIEVTQTQSEFDDKAVAALALQIEQQRQLNREKAEQNAIEKNKKTKATKTRRSTDHVVAEKTLTKEAKEAKKAKEALDNFNTALNTNLKANDEYIKNQETINLLESKYSQGLKGTLAATAALTVSRKIGKTVTGLMAAAEWVYAKAVHNSTKADKAAKAARDALNTSNPFGWAIIALKAVVGLTAAVVALVNLFGWFKSEEEKVAEQLGKLNNEMYELQNRIDSFDKSIDAFDKLDGKLIKTNEDLKEMNSLLEEAANSLTEEERKVYDSLRTNSEKRNYLQLLKEKDLAKLKQDRAQVDRVLSTLNPTKRSAFLNSNTDDARMALDTIKATNNAALYEALDQLGLATDQSAAIREVAQHILENGSADDVDRWMQTGFAEKLAEQLSTLGKMTTQAGETQDIISVLTDSSSSLADQVKAFDAIKESLVGNEEALKAFQQQYGQYEVFSEMGDDVLDFIDKAKLSIDDLNELYVGWKKLQKAGVDITQQQYESLFPALMETLTATGGDIAYATEQVFGEYLNQFEYGTKEWNDAYNSFINSFGDLVAVGVLNMGQNIDALKNTVDNFYEKAREWNKMSETDKTSFISDNSDLFAGEGGQELLKAFQTGNYNKIQEALSTNEGLKNRIKQRAQEVEQELKIEMAKVGDARNEAYIAQLQSYMDYLSDEEKLFQISLEDRLEQEKEQLDQYKSYLEEQKSALEDSLNKRKEAYEKYFDAIKEGEEDQEFEEKVDLITTNLAKLGSSTNASAQNQRNELEKQLQELEKERLQELREKAQEQIMNHMDETIDEINKKFDDLLNSNQALLQAMTGELDNPVNFISKQLAMAAQNGATDLEMEDLVNQLQQTYGSILGDFDWKKLDFTRDENNNLVLNVNGQNTTISGEQGDTLYQAILKALTQIGYKGRI